MGHDRDSAPEGTAGEGGAAGGGLRRRWVTVAAAAAAPVPAGQLAAPVLAHGSLLVEYYAPRGTDVQRPHTRDEVYVVIQGQGWFVNGTERHRFQAHDVLFVPAGVVHRFQDFTDDFAVWVMFYGPQGGEAADPRHT
jgi:mannose-6-phosphate isomerase-like protein (cupin superfamily)